MSVPLQGHRRIERRSLEMHRAIAEKLRAHPELLEIARDNLEDSERMAAMRQATPFAGVLEPSGRWAVYSRFEVR